jgi:hypothetical protein
MAASDRRDADAPDLMSPETNPSASESFLICLPCQRVGVYVDAENIRYNGGYQMRYDVLRRFAARENGILQRL